LMRTSSVQATALSTGGEPEASQAPLSEFQETLVELADRLNEEVGPQTSARAAPVRTEHEGAVHTQQSVARFKGR
jgi:hypothetical protein